jgi:hypothetical protein
MSNRNDTLLDELDHLRARIQQLESNPHSQSASNFVARPVQYEFTPSEAFYEVMPEARLDFFRSPLDDNTRRRFLQRFPTNLDRQYFAPNLNLADTVDSETKRVDRQLADIQYRLSSFLRPYDLFLDELITNRGASFEEIKDFLQSSLSIISDTASLITQTRMDNVCRVNGLTAPRLVDISPPPTNPNGPNLLFSDPLGVLEHTRLARLAKSSQRLPRQSRTKSFGRRSQPHRMEVERRTSTEQTTADPTPATTTPSSRGTVSPNSQTTQNNTRRPFPQRHQPTNRR